MKDICDRYGISVNRASFAVCPFHTEKTPSLKIYKKDFHCFGCGAHGTVIDFVMQLHGIEFASAITRLNFDFQLGLPIGRQLSRREKNALRDAERAREREKRVKLLEERQARAELEKLIAMWQILDTAKTRLAPKDPDAELNPFFLDALHHKEYLEHLIDEKEEEMRRRYGR